MSQSMFCLQNLAAVYHITVCKSSNHKFLCIQEASLGFQECFHLSMNKLHLTLCDCILCKSDENCSTIIVTISLSGIRFLTSTCGHIYAGFLATVWNWFVLPFFQYVFGVHNQIHCLIFFHLNINLKSISVYI